MRCAIAKLFKKRLSFCFSASIKDGVRYVPPHWYSEIDPWKEGVAQTREAAVACIARVWRGEGAQEWLKNTATTDPDEIVRWTAVQELGRE